MNEITRRELLSEVLLNPDEDMPRLIYADFLEEFGNESEVRRAEFIRFQHEVPNSYCTCVAVYEGAFKKCPACKQMVKMNRILSRYGDLWLAEVGVPPPTPKAIGVMGRTTIYRRGFVDEIEVDMEWFDHKQVVKNLFQNHPVSKVTIRGKDPGGYNNVGWYGGRLKKPLDADDVPIEIWDKLNGRRQNYWMWYDTRELALKDLSDGCILYGRSLTDLPELHKWQSTKTPLKT